MVAHELTHGLTECTSALVYVDASGALNESFSDIMGTAVEFYANEPLTSACVLTVGQTVCADWNIGEDIDLRAGTNGFRNMADPEVHGQPDHMSEWYPDPANTDNGGVHTNSGIPNHAFYLLAQGGLNASCATPASHDSSHCAAGGPGTSGAPVVSVGFSDAESIFFLAFIGLPENPTVRGARLATEVVARSQFPASLQSTSDAWEAVGVTATQACDVDVNVSGFPFGAAPYANMTDCIWTYDHGTAGFSFEFSLLDLEPGYDYIYILDANDNVLEELTGTYSGGHTSVPIPTSVGKVRLVSDQFLTAGGFTVTSVSGGVPPPVPPTNLMAVDTPDDAGGAINVSWTPSAANGVLEQRLYRATATLGPYSLVATFADNNQVSFTNQGLTNGTLYFYVMRAFNGAESADSNQASATPLDNGAPPPPMQVVDPVDVVTTTKGTKTQATATVTVESGGAPVNDATVSGGWHINGVLAKTGSGITAGGIATIAAGGLKASESDIVTFCVSDVTHATLLTYAPGASACAGGGGVPPPVATEVTVVANTVLVTAKGKNIRATATVDLDDPAAIGSVAGLTVHGTWTVPGSAAFDGSAVTDASGFAVISSGKLSASAGETITFCVTSVDGVTLVPSAPDCGSGTVP